MCPNLSFLSLQAFGFDGMVVNLEHGWRVYSFVFTWYCSHALNSDESPKKCVHRMSFTGRHLDCSC